MHTYVSGIAVILIRVDLKSMARAATHNSVFPHPASCHHVDPPSWLALSFKS